MTMSGRAACATRCGGLQLRVCARARACRPRGAQARWPPPPPQPLLVVLALQLTLALLVADVRVASAQEPLCQQGGYQPGQWLPRIPGSEYVGSLFDLVGNNQPGANAIVRTYTGLNAPSPVSISGPGSDQLFTVADQLCVAYETSALETYDATAYSSFSEFFSETSVTRSRSSFFSHSTTTTSTIAARMFMHNRSYAYSVSTTRLYEVYLGGLPLQLDPRLQAVLDGLPPTYSSDNTTAEYWAYQDALDQFSGLVMVTAAHMGGSVVGEVWMDRCMFGKYDATFIQQQSSWSIIVVGKMSGWQSAQQNLCGMFFENVETVVVLHGGDTGLFAPDQWGAWQNSTWKAPVPVWFEVEPIENYYGGEALKTNLPLARADFLNRTLAAEQAAFSSLPSPTSNSTEPAWCQPDVQNCADPSSGASAGAGAGARVAAL